MENEWISEKQVINDIVDDNKRLEKQVKKLTNALESISTISNDSVVTKIAIKALQNKDENTTTN